MKTEGLGGLEKENGMPEGSEAGEAEGRPRGEAGWRTEGCGMEGCGMEDASGRDGGRRVGRGGSSQQPTLPRGSGTDTPEARQEVILGTPLWGHPLPSAPRTPQGWPASGCAPPPQPYTGRPWQNPEGDVLVSWGVRAPSAPPPIPNSIPSPQDHRVGKLRHGQCGVVAQGHPAQAAPWAHCHARGGGLGTAGMYRVGGGNVPTATLPMCLSFPPQEPSLEGEGGSPKNSGLRVWVRVGRGVSGLPPSPPPRTAEGGVQVALYSPCAWWEQGEPQNSPPRYRGGCMSHPGSSGEGQS